MGYYTYLAIEIDKEEPTINQVAETLTDETGDTGAAYWGAVLSGGGRSIGTSANPTCGGSRSGTLRRYSP